MRIPASLLLAPVLLLPALTHAQAAPATASSILSPALDRLRQSLSAVRLEKWKAPGPARQDASSNMGSIQRDLDGTLPALLAAADAAPGQVSKTLPVFRNVDALYDVLLRVVETADLSAPETDTDTLQGALAALDDARRTLGDQMQAASLSQEQQVGALQEKLRAQAAATAAPVPSTVVNDGSKPATTHRRHSAKPAQPPAQPPQ